MSKFKYNQNTQTNLTDLKFISINKHEKYFLIRNAFKKRDSVC